LDQERRDRLAGIGLGVLGVVVLALAIVALRHPGNDTAAAVPRPTVNTTTHHTSTPPSRHPVTHVSPSSTPSSTGPSSGAPSSGAPSSTVPDGEGKLPLVVMNQTSTTGLAASAEARFEAKGWTVTHIGTMTNDVTSTTAYYDPTVAGSQAAAEALQAQFSFIKRVQPRFAELYAGPVVVVLTWDYTSGA
jgi:hypothetical protein